MDSQVKEIKAVNAVKDAFLPYSISPDIKDGDKKPAVDGELYIYQIDSIFKKANLIGQVSVQVKGTEVQSFSNSSCKYTVNIEDLVIYERDYTGALFFVVEILNVDSPSGVKSVKTKIFFKEFLPDTIRTILKDKKGNQKSVSEEFFPLLPGRERKICEDFLLHSKKQMKTIILLDKSIPRFQDFILYEDSFNDVAELSLFEKSYLIYEQVNGEEIFQSKGRIVEEALNLDEKIRVVNKICFESVKITETLTDYSFIFGELVTIKNSKQLVNEKYKMQVTFKITGSASHSIMCLNFLKSFIQGDDIFIGDKRCISMKDMSIDSEEIGVFEKRVEDTLKILERFNKVFERFGITKLIDVSQLSSEDIEKLEQLAEFIVDRNFSKFVSEDIIFLTEIGKYKIASFKFIQEDNIELISFFDRRILEERQIRIKIQDDPTEKHYKFSPYGFIKVEDWCTLSNINFDILRDSIVFSNDEIVYNELNKFMLKLISAYDFTNDVNFLRTAKYGLSLLDGIELSDDTSFLIFLNKLQIKIRFGERIDESEIEKLYFYRNTKTSNIAQVGIALILGNEPDFVRFFDKLSETEQSSFKEYPIYYLSNKFSVI